MGLTRLAEWVRETARSGGLVSAPFCFGQQDAAARDWQSPAVEKRCEALLMPHYCQEALKWGMCL